MINQIKRKNQIKIENIKKQNKKQVYIQIWMCYLFLTCLPCWLGLIRRPIRVDLSFFTVTDPYLYYHYYFGRLSFPPAFTILDDRAPSSVIYKIYIHTAGEPVFIYLF